MNMKSIELGTGDSDVKPTAHDPQYDYAELTIVRGPTKPSTMGLSPETHLYSHLRRENSTSFGGCYDSIDQSAQYLVSPLDVTWILLFQTLF